VQRAGVGIWPPPLALKGFIAGHVGDDLPLLANCRERIDIVRLTTRIRWLSPAFPAEPGLAAARGSTVKV
jgi:hypothetical protein